MRIVSNNEKKRQNNGDLKVESVRVLGAKSNLQMRIYHFRKIRRLNRTRHQ